MATHASDSVFASDRDREVVCNQLAIATGEGRITPGEHEELVERALASRKRGELRRLIDELPNPKLPDLPTQFETPAKQIGNSKDTFGFFVMILAVLILTPLMIWGMWKISTSSNDITSPSISASPTPTPTATATDPQDRAFVQAMIDYHNDCRYNYGNCNSPTNIDQAAVLDITHRLRNPTNDVRQQFLLIMDPGTYKGLTKWEKYHAGKMALGIWRAGDEAAWVQLGKDQGYE